MHKVEMTILESGRAPVAGLPTGIIPGIKLLQSKLIDPTVTGYLPDAAFQLWLEAGGYYSDAAPMHERDMVDPTRIWTCDNAVDVRVTDPAVMGGALRWQFTNQAEEGFRGAIPSSAAGWAGITVWVPDFELVAGVNTCIFSIGSGSNRPTLYVNSAGRLIWYDTTTGTPENGTGAEMAIGTRHTVMLTLNVATLAATLYIDSSTPIASGTVSGPITTSLNAGIGGSFDDAIDGASKFSEIAVLNLVPSTTQIANLMEIGRRIRTYPGL